MQRSSLQTVFTDLLGRVDHRRGSWGSAKKLGYQEYRKKRVLCQGVGVKPQAVEQSRKVESQRSHQNAKLVGQEETRSEQSVQTKESWSKT